MFRTGIHVTDASFRQELQERFVHLFSLPSLPPLALPLPVCFPCPLLIPSPLLPLGPPLHLPLPPPLTLLRMYPSPSPSCPFLAPASAYSAPETLVPLPALTCCCTYHTLGIH